MDDVWRHRTSPREEKLDPEAEAQIVQIREHACNLYESRQYLCTEAVLVSVNRGLNGGLSDSQATALAAPFCVALGDSGCLCGALSGAIMATGLLLGSEKPYRRRGEMRNSARRLHDAFKAENGATCCRVLSKKVRHDKKAHFAQCADLTARAAEMAARLILQKRPGLIDGKTAGSSARRYANLEGAVLRILHYFCR